MDGSGSSFHPDSMTEPEVKHAAFRLEHTVRWNPQLTLVRTIRVDPPVTHEEARRMVQAELPALTRAGTWSLMDGSQFIRGADIASIRVMPAGVTPDDAGIGFGLTVIHGD
jgi:hypothetical protein